MNPDEINVNIAIVLLSLCGRERLPESGALTGGPAISHISKTDDGCSNSQEDESTDGEANEARELSMTANNPYYWSSNTWA